MRNQESWGHALTRNQESVRVVPISGTESALIQYVAVRCTHLGGAYRGQKFTSYGLRLD